MAYRVHASCYLICSCAVVSANGSIRLVVETRAGSKLATPCMLLVTLVVSVLVAGRWDLGITLQPRECSQGKMYRGSKNIARTITQRDANGRWRLVRHFNNIMWRLRGNFGDVASRSDAPFHFLVILSRCAVIATCALGACVQTLHNTA